MRKRLFRSLYFPLASLIFIAPGLKAQVLDGSITLFTQAQVDAFNYTEVIGSVTITGSGITNLDGLSELTKIRNSLQIVNNPALTNINGLLGLKSVSAGIGNLVIRNNDALTNIDGLSNLESVWHLTIEGNFRLSNIDGLSGLATHSIGILTIDNNHSLTNVNGLSNHLGFHTVVIKNNSILTDLNGFSHFKNVGGGLTIESNPLLTNIDGLSNVDHVGPLRIVSTPLTNLDALSKVSGDLDGLVITHNPNLTNFDALSDVSDMLGPVIIEANNALTNLDGLSGLGRVLGSLVIRNNAALTNVDGLLELEHVTLGGSLVITNNDALTNLDGLSNLETVRGNLTIQFNNVLVDFCGLTELFNSGIIDGTIRITDNGANTVLLTPPADITVNADAGVCSVTLLNAALGTSTVAGCLKPAIPAAAGLPPGNIFPVGSTQIIWSVTDGAGNMATATQTVTVVDTQIPVISCPAALTVSCAADVPAVNINSVVATDNCSAVVEHVSDVISNQTCANRFILTRTYKATDPAGNSATCAQVITVNDNVPPQINDLSVSQTTLGPPNHKMHDIMVNYTVSDNCIATPNVAVSVTSNEPVNGTGDGDTAPDWEVVGSHHVRLRAERAGNGNGRIYTITVTANDGCNPPVSSSAQVEVPHNSTEAQTVNPLMAGATENVGAIKGALNVRVSPNPSASRFGIIVNSSNRLEKIIMQVTDAAGRVVETRSVPTGQMIHFGERFISGVYYVTVVQGKEQKRLKLVKLK